MPSIVTSINNILIISLSNIGDLVLTFPVIDRIKANYPQAKVSVVIGPKGLGLLKRNHHFHDVIIFDKTHSAWQKFLWLLEQRKKKYDCVIDLRNTMIPFFLNPKIKTSPFKKKDPTEHMRDKHIRKMLTALDLSQEARERFCLDYNDIDRRRIDHLKEKFHFQDGQYLIMAPGSANPGKRWPWRHFARTAQKVMDQYSLPSLLIGDRMDADFAEEIVREAPKAAINLCGVTTILQSAMLIEKAVLNIMNDSAPMHIASYLDKPVIAIFGPSSPLHYGPWSAQNKFFQKPPRSFLSNPSVKKNKKNAQALLS
ncbi:MAG: glycosyltransferase family 9 protein, partial [Candidatus Omnitrophica bacterium]|nr:glycosyltransferase family 9 protein [Candidatus Omnitrophota bacterium]